MGIADTIVRDVLQTSPDWVDITPLTDFPGNAPCRFIVCTGAGIITITNQAAASIPFPMIEGQQLDVMCFGSQVTDIGEGLFAAMM